VEAGLRRAKENGKKLGRPVGSAVHNKHTERAKQLRSEGLSLRLIAGQLGISKSTVQRLISCGT